MTPLALPLTGIAVALSGVTAASVGMAVFALIDDKVLATMFAGAAILLDVFKYMAWPVADRLDHEGRGSLSSLMLASALVLAGVSGWATYDRLAGALKGREAGVVAVTQQRIKDVEAARAADMSRLQDLDADAALIRRQAAALTDLGRVSKAAELAAAGKAGAEGERREVLSRLDNSSVELTKLKSRAAPATLPALSALLLCLGFALALELVPVLIFLSVRKAKADVVPVLVPEPEPVPEPLYSAVPEPKPEIVETPQLQPEPVPEPTPVEEVFAVAKPPEEHLPEPVQEQMLEPAPADPLLDKLLSSLQGIEPGTSVPIKKFARDAGIGNTKAGELFTTAAERGALVKTTRGYVAA